MKVLEEGGKVWPRLAAVVSEAELADFLAARLPAEPPPSADLLLVCACVLGRPGPAAREEAVEAPLVGGERRHRLLGP